LSIEAWPISGGALRLYEGVLPGVAMVCALGLLSLGRIPFQAAVMGIRFALINIISSIFLPII